jgi:predicted amidohydrolase YtcJ
MPWKNADLLVRAGAVHTLAPGQPAQRALAARGDRIVAVSPTPDGLDEWIGPETVVVDRPDSAVLPTFDDTHTHLIFAGNAAHDVPVHQARTIPEIIELIRRRAEQTPAGRWIRTTANWQEVNLAERRFPTADELDGATDAHPVLMLRGGHNAVANHEALRLAGITEDTADPDGGRLGRDTEGRLTGCRTTPSHWCSNWCPRPAWSDGSRDCGWPARISLPRESAWPATRWFRWRTWPCCGPLWTPARSTSGSEPWPRPTTTPPRTR